MNPSEIEHLRIIIIHQYPNFYILSLYKNGQNKNPNANKKIKKTQRKNVKTEYPIHLDSQTEKPQCIAWIRLKINSHHKIFIKRKEKKGKPVPMKEDEAEGPNNIMQASIRSGPTCQNQDTEITHVLTLI